MNNRSLEDALAIVFGESLDTFTSATGATIEQATQIPYESVCSIELL